MLSTASKIDLAYKYTVKKIKGKIYILKWVHIN